MRGPGKGKTNNPNGRPKGTKNKVQKDLVQKILDISEQLAKEKKGLLDCAKKDPEWFHTNFLKALIPKNIEFSGVTEITLGASDALMAKLNEIYVHTGRS